MKNINMKVNIKKLFLLITLHLVLVLNAQEIPFSVSNLATLTKPKNVKASDGTNYRAINISWNKVKSAREYKVYRGKKAAIQSMSLVTTISKNFVVDSDRTELKPEIEYFYRIKALGQNKKESDYSYADVGFLKKGIASIVPSAWRAPTEALPNERTTLEWMPVSNATAYHVQIANSDKKWNVISGFENEKNYIDTIVTSTNIKCFFNNSQIGQSYQWTIAAIQNGQQSAFSYPISLEISDEELLGNDDNATVILKSITTDNDHLKYNTYYRFQTQFENITSNQETNFRLAFFLSTDATLSRNDIKIGSTHLFEVNANAVDELTPMKKISNKIPSGSYHLIVAGEEEGKLNDKNLLTIVVTVK